MKAITPAPAGPPVKTPLATSSFVTPDEAYAISNAAAQDKCAAGLPKLLILGMSAGELILTYGMLPLASSASSRLLGVVLGSPSAWF